MATQFYVPGAAQIWVGTRGVLPTRIVFGGGGPLASGANAVVRSVTPGQCAVSDYQFTDTGRWFVRTPTAITVGGGWGFCQLGNVDAGQVTGVTKIPSWPASLTINKGAGQGFRPSSDFGFEFLGWTESGVSHDVNSTHTVIQGDAAGETPPEYAVQSKTTRMHVVLKRYSQEVLEACLSRGHDFDGIGSYSGITFVPEKPTAPRPIYPRSVGAGSLVLAQFCFFPIVILCPYAYTTPKRWLYGIYDEYGNEQNGIHEGYHFPAVTVASINETTSWRVRRVTLSLSMHWVSNPLTRAGLLYDHAVGCIRDANGNFPQPD